MATLLPVEEQYYEKIFSMYKSEGDVVSQARVVDLLSKSHLSQPVLAQIWALSAQGRIEIPREDFYDLIRYVALAQEQIELNVVNLCKEGPRIPRFAGIPTPALPSPTTSKRLYQNVASKKEDLSWLMAREQIDFYENTRRALDVNGTGMVDGNTASGMFLKSGLTTHELKEIWELADTRKVGALNRAQFHVAMHLIIMRKTQGKPIPKLLPGPLQAHITNFENMAAQQKGAPQQQQQQPEPQAQGANGQQQQQHPPGVQQPQQPQQPHVAPVSNDELYQVDAQAEQFYLHTFNLVDTDNDGEITASEARDLLAKSELPNEELMHIWSLSDTKQRGRLSRAEFMTAMHIIIVRKKHKQPLPVTLPAPLQALILSEAKGGMPDFHVTIAAPSQPQPQLQPQSNNDLHHHQPLTTSTPTPTTNNSNSLQIVFEDTARTVSPILERGLNASPVPPAASTRFTVTTTTTTTTTTAAKPQQQQQQPQNSFLSFDNDEPAVAVQPQPQAAKKPASSLPTNLDDAIMSTFVASVGVMSAAMTKSQTPAAASPVPPAAQPAPSFSAGFGDDGFGVNFGSQQQASAQQQPQPQPQSFQPAQPQGGFHMGFGASFDAGFGQDSFGSSMSSNVPAASTDLFAASNSSSTSTFNSQSSFMPISNAGFSDPTKPLSTSDSADVQNLKRQVDEHQRTISQLQSLIQSLTQQLERVVETQKTQQRQLEELQKRPAAQPAPALNFFDDDASSAPSTAASTFAAPAPAPAPAASASAASPSIPSFGSAFAAFSQPSSAPQQSASFAAFDDNSFSMPAQQQQPAQKQQQQPAKPAANVNDFLQSDFGDDQDSFFNTSTTTTTTTTTTTSKAAPATTSSVGASAVSLFDMSSPPVLTVSQAPLPTSSPVAPPAIPARSRVSAAATSVTPSPSASTSASMASLFASTPTPTPAPAVAAAPAPAAAAPPASASSSAPARSPSPQPIQLVKPVIKTEEPDDDDDDDGEVVAFGFGQTVQVQDKAPIASGRIRAASLLARDGDQITDGSTANSAQAPADFDSFGKANNPFESASFEFGASSGFSASGGFGSGNPFGGSSAAAAPPSPTPASAAASGFDSQPSDNPFDAPPSSAPPASPKPESNDFGAAGFGDNSAFGGAAASGFGAGGFGDAGFNADSGFGSGGFGDSGFGGSETTAPKSEPTPSAPAPAHDTPAAAAAAASGFGSADFGSSGFDNSFDQAFDGFGDGFGASQAATPTPAPVAAAPAAAPAPATSGFENADFDKAFSGFDDAFN